MLRYIMTLLFFMTVCGCGSAKYDLPTPTNIPSKKASVTESLKGYASSGVLDSGVSTLKENIEGLKTEGVGETDKLNTIFTALENAKSPEQVKKLANDALQLLK